MHNIPILQALTAHLKTNPLALHVPGHKMGRGFPGEAASWFGQSLKLDLTELAGLDDLHQPEGAILQAQQLAAQAFGSDETYFLVGGSTAGNLAMVLSACGPGDSIIIPRNAHKSVHNAVALAGARPVYIYPHVDKRFGIPTFVPVEAVRVALQQHPEARAVLITSPTYQGISSDVTAIAEEVHLAGKQLLVDEAHGAHFVFHEKLPPSAIESGADLAVQSTHKMLGSLTGSAMLHGRSGRYNGDRLRMMLSMVQSSSPSYLLLASLDAVRYQMAVKGRDMLEQAMQALQSGREAISKLRAVRLYEPDESVSGADPFKWWLQVKGLGITGYQAEKVLREQKGIYFEMADAGHVLAVFSMADTVKQVARLLEGVLFLTEKYQIEDKKTDSIAERLPIGQFSLEQAMIPKDALHRDSRHVKLEAAVGQIAAEPVIPYPPGIPVVLPGERYTPQLVAYLLETKLHGSRFQGTADASLEYVRVTE